MYGTTARQENILMRHPLSLATCELPIKTSSEGVTLSQPEEPKESPDGKSQYEGGTDKGKEFLPRKYYLIHKPIKGGYERIGGRYADETTARLHATEFLPVEHKGCTILVTPVINSNEIEIDSPNENIRIFQNGKEIPFATWVRQTLESGDIPDVKGKDGGVCQ